MKRSTTRARYDFLRRLVLMALAATVPDYATAELRTWSDVTGKFKVEAELLRADAENVWLKQADGKEVKVARSKLSEADRKFVAAWQKQQGAGDSQQTLADLERRAQQCRTAKEASMLYQMFLADPDTPAHLKRSVEERARYWKNAAERKLTRVGTRWVEADEAKKSREKADTLMKQGLELVRIGSVQLGVDKLKEASQLDPDGINADFAMAILSLMNERWDLAERHLTECRRRAPKSAWVANDLAICQTMLGKLEDAGRTWIATAKLAPDDDEIAQNVAKFVLGAGNMVNHPRFKKKTGLKKSIQDAADLYSKMVADGRVRGADVGQSWRFMYPEEEELERIPEQPESTHMVSGTGFVVAPGYVMTNHHVVRGARHVGVADPRHPGGTPLGATVVAKSDKVDLAILRCADLDAPPLAIRSEGLARGMQLMVLGFPLGDLLGNQLKATQGAVTSLPDAATKGCFLLDATINPGNSGGPVCDATGAVIGVATISLSASDGRRQLESYGGALPAKEVVALAKEHIPGFAALLPATEKLEWTAVDELCSPSVVMIVASVQE